MTARVTSLRVSRGSVLNTCYVVQSTEAHEALLVDPAWEEQKVEAALEGRKVMGVLLTHHHRDHVDLAAALARRHGCPVLMSGKEIERYRFRCDGLHAIASEGWFQLGSLQAWAHFTPGHTAGSVCYEAYGALFTGDTLFSEGCGICTGEGGSAEAMYDSLTRLSACLPEETRIYAGHSYGQPVGQTLAEVRKHNIYLHFRSRAEFVRFRMREGQTRLFAFR